MPPKPKISKEMILTTVLNITRETGFEAVNARSIAGKLQCSTRPIFTCYENMEELKKEVFAAALKIFGQALRREVVCESRYLALGLNYIRFAAEERELFRLLFMSDFGKTDLIGANVEMEYVLRVIEETEHITGDNARIIYRDMWLFSHGIAAMIAAGTAEFSEDELRGMLSGVCRALISSLEKNK